MDEKRAKELASWMLEAVKEFGGENREWDRAVRLTFKGFPGDSYEQMLIKASVVNQLYSAQVLGKHIDDVAALLASETLHFLSRASQGDLVLVDDIRTGLPKKYFSFAAKFCHFSNPDAYPLYDQYAEYALRSSIEGLAIGPRLSNEDFKQVPGGYSLYRDSIVSLIKALGFPHSFKQMDEGLWMLGQCIHQDTKSSARVVGYLAKVGAPPTWLPTPR